MPRTFLKTLKYCRFTAVWYSLYCYTMPKRGLKDVNKRSLRVGLFEISAPRKILGLTSRDHIRNVDFLKEVALTSFRFYVPDN